MDVKFGHMGNANIVDTKSFQTHLNYVRFLNGMPKYLNLEYTCKLTSKIPFIAELEKKSTLVNLTKEGLKNEWKLVHIESQYSLMCVPWIPVKSYYLLFYQLQILNYLITGQSNAFKSTHHDMNKWFKKSLTEGSLLFDLPPLNQNFPLEVIAKIKTPQGFNLRVQNFDFDERFYQILKKLSIYKIDEFKTKSKIDPLNKASEKVKLLEFVKRENICLFEFFYFYRIKANYRDLDFINGILPSSLTEYYCHYCIFTMKFSDALRNCINEVSNQRFGKFIL